jgi:tripartite-type tricarboxylate transporter receptor subunit TctC
MMARRVQAKYAFKRTWLKSVIFVQQKPGAGGAIYLVRRLIGSKRVAAIYAGA